MSKFYSYGVTAYFWGIFGQAREFFGGNFEKNYISIF